MLFVSLNILRTKEEIMFATEWSILGSHIEPFVFSCALSNVLRFGETIYRSFYTNSKIFVRNTKRCHSEFVKMVRNCFYNILSPYNMPQYYFNLLFTKCSYLNLSMIWFKKVVASFFFFFGYIVFSPLSQFL